MDRIERNTYSNTRGQASLTRLSSITSSKFSKQPENQEIASTVENERLSQQRQNKDASVPELFVSSCHSLAPHPSSFAGYVTASRSRNLDIANRPLASPKFGTGALLHARNLDMAKMSNRGNSVQPRSHQQPTSQSSQNSVTTATFPQIDELLRNHQRVSQQGAAAHALLTSTSTTDLVLPLETPPSSLSSPASSSRSPRSSPQHHLSLHSRHYSHSCTLTSPQDSPSSPIWRSSLEDRKEGSAQLHEGKASPSSGRANSNQDVMDTSNMTLAELATTEMWGELREQQDAAAGNGSIAFWGGAPSRLEIFQNYVRVGSRGTPGTDRPETASSLWSNYDLEEGTLAKLETSWAEEASMTAKQLRDAKRKKTPPSTAPTASKLLRARPGASVVAALSQAAAKFQARQNAKNSSSSIPRINGSSSSSINGSSSIWKLMGAADFGAASMQPRPITSATDSELSARITAAVMGSATSVRGASGPHTASSLLHGLSTTSGWSQISTPLPITVPVCSISSTGSSVPSTAANTCYPPLLIRRTAVPLPKRPPLPPAARGVLSGAENGKPMTHGSSKTLIANNHPPSPRLLPFERSHHPAAIMDPFLLTPCLRPVDEIPVDAKGRPYPYVLPPCFPGAYPTIAFMGSAQAKQALGLHPLLRTSLSVKYAGIANNAVKHAFKEASFKVVKGSKWNVCWGNILEAEEYGKLHEFQRVNHFPGTWELGRKDYLYRNVYNMRRSKGETFDIIPHFFILPRDYDDYLNDLERNPGRLYIQKPVNSSRGRGISMVVKPSDICRDTKDLLVQHYIDNPYTINNFKFDLRVYVVATCVDPLRLYVYEDGLARFATEPFSKEKADLGKRCVHLTNYSVNKKSSKFVANNGAGSGAAVNGLEGEQLGEGDDNDSTASKWSIAAVRGHVEREGRTSWDHIWKQVHDIAAKAILSAEPKLNTEVKMKVAHRNNCFEVWGLDIMLDDNFKAWLIEANTCPSLASDSALDKRIKNALLADVMNLVGVVPYDADAYDEVKGARRQARLTGLTVPSAHTSVNNKANNSSNGSGADNKAVSASGGVSAVHSPRGAGTASATKSATTAMPKTVMDAEAMDFRGMNPEDLPEIICEAEAEYARRRGWQRVFPCVEDPSRYLDLFDTPRSGNIMLCNYYAQQSGHRSASLSSSGLPLSRSGSKPLLTYSRPSSAFGSSASREWRNGSS